MSRGFVCVRIESYENEESQDWVRNFLGGRFENTAFCILDPSGEDRLSRSNRGPSQVFRDPVSELKAIADEYNEKGEREEAILNDFLSLRQAINIGSADQRLLMVLKGEGDALAEAQEELRPVQWSADTVGRYHVDTLGAEDEELWEQKVAGSSDGDGIYIIEADKYGMEGKVVAKLPLNSDAEKVTSVLAEANVAFAKSTEKKNYSDHVSAGRRDGIYFEPYEGIEYGEDRDGDGVVDHGGVAREKGAER